MGCKMIIYKVQNKVNGKIYIGQTKFTLEERILYHLKVGDSPAFHNSIKKYGIENFEISIIDSAKTKEELNDKEKYWIKFYDSNNRIKGYNLTDGGDGFSGYEFSGENNPMYGKHHSEETKENIRKSRLGKRLPDEVKEKIRRSMTGKKFPEHSNMMKGENNPAKRLEVRDKITKAKTGKSNTKIVGENNPTKRPEVRKKISESLKGKPSGTKGRHWKWRQKLKGL